MEETSVDESLQMSLQLMIPDQHAKEFQCPVCAKYFSRKFTLDAHMLIHKGEKPYACQFCGKCFRQKGTLMRHKALHSTKHLFHCSLCNRGFRQKNVFIHHLRHRHNVSTETLDRRKYRTQPKDYQSIMDTLPSFVHADSAAIVSSEKHFDALLFKSIQTSANDSLHTSEYDNVVQSSIHSCNVKNISEEEHICSAISDTNNLNRKTSCLQNPHAEENTFDIKPVIVNNIDEGNANCDFLEVPYSSSPNLNVLNPSSSALSNSNNVTNSEDFDEENLFCTSCQCSFDSEVDFKHHLQIHIQNIVCEKENSNDPRSSVDAQKSAENSFHSENSISRSDSTPLIISTHSKINLPIKSEMLDSEIDSCSSSIEVSQTPLSVARGSKSLQKLRRMFCPICKLHFLGEDSFKNHSQTHDSYSLLKLISKSSGTKKKSFYNQKSIPNVSSDLESYISKHPKNRLQPKITRIFGYSKKSKARNNPENNKSNAKTYHCLQCYKKFSNRLMFEYHRQLHLSVKGFACNCCKKSFATKKLLLAHTRSYHMKSFTCSKCSCSFNYRQLFDWHRKKCNSTPVLQSLSGNLMNFPVMDIESLLNSNLDDVVGIIPVSDSNGVKVGIPVMSLSHMKSLYLPSSNE